MVRQTLKIKQRKHVFILFFLYIFFIFSKAEKIENWRWTNIKEMRKTIFCYDF